MGSGVCMVIFCCLRERFFLIECCIVRSGFLTVVMEYNPQLTMKEITRMYTFNMAGYGVHCKGDRSVSKICCNCLKNK